MAEKRMFALKIINSDKFLEMPATAQLLYFHLGMRADDEGFVDFPATVMRMVGAQKDDLRILAMRNFIIPLAQGVIVITHWKVHNNIRPDRIKETTCKQERSLLATLPDGRYSLKENAQPSIQNGNKDAQICRTNDRIGLGLGLGLGKDLENKDKKETLKKKEKESLLLEKFNKFWEAYPKKIDKKRALKTFGRINPDDKLLTVMIEAIKTQELTDSWCREAGQFIPYPATWLNGERWNDEPSSLQGKKVLTSQSSSGVLKLANMIQNGEFDEPQGSSKTD